MEVKIRKASKKDMKRLLEDASELMKIHLPYDREANLLKKGYSEIQKKYFLKKLASKDAVIYIAEVGGKYAGYCLVRKEKRPPLYVLKEQAYIDAVFVRRVYRRAGIASLFFKHAEKWAKEKGYLRLALSVNVKNKAAKKAYLQQGLKVTSFGMSKMLD